MKNKFTINPLLAVAILVAAGLSISSTAFALRQPTGKAKEQQTDAKKESALSAKDKTFMMGAAKDGMMEVEMGKMAQQKGQSDEVEKIGARMVADHTKANNELMALAKQKGVDLSKVKASKHKIGADNFDKDYLDHMVKDHQKDISEFRAQSKEGTDADLKKFASKTLPVLEKHLQMVKKAQGGKAEGTTASKAKAKTEDKAEKTEAKADEKADKADGKAKEKEE